MSDKKYDVIVAGEYKCLVKDVNIAKLQEKRAALSKSLFSVDYFFIWLFC